MGVEVLEVLCWLRFWGLVIFIRSNAVGKIGRVRTEAWIVSVLSF